MRPSLTGCPCPFRFRFVTDPNISGGCMKRRRFLTLTTIASFGLTTRSVGAGDKSTPRVVESHPETSAKESNVSVDSYFLDSGEIVRSERAQIEAFIEYRDLASAGKSNVTPRSSPKRAPTYRFMHWSGDLGNPSGRFVGAFGLSPGLPSANAYAVNAQILNFHGASKDWPRALER